MEDNGRVRRQNTALASLLVVCAVIVVSLWLLRDRTSAPSLAEIQRYSGIRFPKSTNLLNSQLTGSIIGGSLIAKVEVHHTDSDSFARSLHNARKLRGPMAVVFAEPVSWWKQGHGQAYATYVGEGPSPVGRYIVDMHRGTDGTDVVFMYVERRWR